MTARAAHPAVRLQPLNRPYGLSPDPPRRRPCGPAARATVRRRAPRAPSLRLAGREQPLPFGVSNPHRARVGAGQREGPVPTCTGLPDPTRVGTPDGHRVLIETSAGRRPLTQPRTSMLSPSVNSRPLTDSFERAALPGSSSRPALEQPCARCAPPSRSRVSPRCARPSTPADACARWRSGSRSATAGGGACAYSWAQSSATRLRLLPLPAWVSLRLPRLGVAAGPASFAAPHAEDRPRPPRRSTPTGPSEPSSGAV